MGGERGGQSNHEHVQSGRVHHCRHRCRRRAIPTLAHSGEELYARGVGRELGELHGAILRAQEGGEALAQLVLLRCAEAALAKRMQMEVQHMLQQVARRGRGGGR